MICSAITGYSCDFGIEEDDNEFIDFLKHINEIHDPQFVPRCIDDLKIEYQDYLERIAKLLQGET